MNHDHYSDDYLCKILARTHTVALVGASARDDRPSHWVLGFLLGKGYQVFPVNPALAGTTILGRPVHARLADIGVPIDLIDVFRRSESLSEVVDEALALERRPKGIWGQLGVRDDDAAAKAEVAGIDVVMNRALVAEYPLVYQASHIAHRSPTAA
ncbi:CoA-binding protein [Agrobacterium vitis]|uniref:CoA-binding protein n=1 Tax=Allorhizobium ampelinum TaxID=3025782 RepID=UPI001F2DDDDA|nr:CoA-binding protein [Allorhizobium ampelinum]MCF1459804.1 CoA-binding protein [Allorhizobium ampelinum]MCF1474483.1 CoA-binding protein [Allorhizobium ampelinum]